MPLEKLPEDLLEDVREELQFMYESDPLPIYKSKIMDILPDKFSMNDEMDVIYLSMLYDQMVHECYVEEYEVIIQFLMNAVQNSFAKKQKDRKAYLKFISSKKYMLFALGIQI